MLCRAEEDLLQLRATIAKLMQLLEFLVKVCCLVPLLVKNYSLRQV